MAGYSKKSLVHKLGIKVGSRVLFLNPPQNYRDVLGDLPEDVALGDDLFGPLDFIQIFVRERAELARIFPELKQNLAYDGMLWVSWPKRVSKVPIDLKEDVVREIGLSNGLVDVKVSAIDEIWSGLKFVYRLKDRK